MKYLVCLATLTLNFLNPVFADTQDEQDQPEMCVSLTEEMELDQTESLVAGLVEIVVPDQEER